MTFRWTGDKLTAQLLWRQIGEVDDDDPGTLFTVETIDSEAYFDLSGTYRFTDNYAVTFGIDNVADSTPPILGDNQGQRPGARHAQGAHQLGPISGLLAGRQDTGHGQRRHREAVGRG